MKTKKPNKPTINNDAEKTFEQLILDNENFVYSVVNKEFKQYPLSVKQDLYSAGKYGLVYAATKFDRSNYSNKFISYAVHWIRFYVNEEIRKLYPVKLNQNYIYKRTKIKKFISDYEEKHGKTPSMKAIVKGVGMSEKVIQNVMNINNGENFKFISFQATTSNNNDDPTSDSYIENKLVNEYLESEDTNYNMINFELNDMLSELKQKLKDKNFDDNAYNMFIDKYLYEMSYSDIAKKYKLNFPSSSKYLIERVSNVCKELVG